MRCGHGGYFAPEVRRGANSYEEVFHSTPTRAVRDEARLDADFYTAVFYAADRGPPPRGWPWKPEEARGGSGRAATREQAARNEVRSLRNAQKQTTGKLEWNAGITRPAQRVKPRETAPRTKATPRLPCYAGCASGIGPGPAPFSLFRPVQRPGDTPPAEAVPGRHSPAGCASGENAPARHLQGEMHEFCTPAPGRNPPG